MLFILSHCKENGLPRHLSALARNDMQKLGRCLRWQEEMLGGRCRGNCQKRPCTRRSAAVFCLSLRGTQRLDNPVTTQKRPLHTQKRCLSSTCHCYENKVGILPKRVQETNPEPCRVFSVRLCSGHSSCWGGCQPRFCSLFR